MIEKTMLLILIAIIVCLQVCESKADDYDGDKIYNIEKKILWLTSNETTPIKKYSRKINKTELEELTRAIDMASLNYEIEPDYIIVIAWFETVFRNLVGDNGRSIGEMQVGKMGRKKCKCDMLTVASRIDCGACWLDMGRRWCGSIESGLQAYIGGSCEARTVNAKRSYNRRIKIVKTIKSF